MTKAKKAPSKRTQQPRNRGIRIASALFIALGVLVVLSMILSSVFTQTPQVVVPVASPFPTAVFTPVP
jgi:hypothetical protein